MGENINQQQIAFTEYEWQSAYCTPACKWEKYINIRCKKYLNVEWIILAQNQDSCGLNWKA